MTNVDHPLSAWKSRRPGLFGRTRECDELRACLADALGGTSRLVLLAGDPGIGKTRLADELAGEAAARGAIVAWGRCWEAGGAPVYWPWIEILRACARDCPADSLDVLRAQQSPHVAAFVAQFLPARRPSRPRPRLTPAASIRAIGFTSSTPSPRSSAPRLHRCRSS
jgi:hypothetical protein